ncbi:hypothetical protein IWX90DRAFT_214135 [Phyllosticta citrichinensis]|uniref:Uncharacterized protein n=1 Tax=Phyllosticta citrichinensis TaxID=1130410 RepID=A0ABR1XT76_9PEZI
MSAEPVSAAYGSSHHKSDSKLLENDGSRIPGLPRHIDWRKQICATLGIDQKASDADVLVAIQQNDPMRPQISESEPQFAIIYQVNCKSDDSRLKYEDMPCISNSESCTNHLRDRKLMNNYDVHVERHPGLSFIVYKMFTCCQKCVEKKSRAVRSSLFSRQTQSPWFQTTSFWHSSKQQKHRKEAIYTQTSIIDND